MGLPMDIHDQLWLHTIAKAVVSLAAEMKGMKRNELETFIGVFTHNPRLLIDAMVRDGLIEERGGAITCGEAYEGGLSTKTLTKHCPKIKTRPVKTVLRTLEIMCSLRKAGRLYPTEYAMKLWIYGERAVKEASKRLNEVRELGLATVGLDMSDARRRIYKLSEIGDELFPYLNRAILAYCIAREVIAIEVEKPRPRRYGTPPMDIDEMHAPYSLYVHPWTTKWILAKEMARSHPSIFTKVDFGIRTSDILKDSGGSGSLALTPVGDENGYYHEVHSELKDRRFIASLRMPSIKMIVSKNVNDPDQMIYLEGTVSEKSLVKRARECLKRGVDLKGSNSIEDILRGFVEESTRGKCKDAIVAKSPCDYILDQAIPSGIRVIMDSGEVEMALYGPPNSEVNVEIVRNVVRSVVARLRVPAEAVRAAWRYVSDMKDLPCVKRLMEGWW